MNRIEVGLESCDRDAGEGTNQVNIDMRTLILVTNSVNMAAVVIRAKAALRSGSIARHVAFFECVLS